MTAILQTYALGKRFELVVCAAAKTLLTVVVVGPRPEPGRASGKRIDSAATGQP